MAGSTPIAVQLVRHIAAGKLRVVGLLLAIVATFTMIGGAPAHAVEDLRGPAAVHVVIAVSASAGDHRANPHTLPGHLCAAHCPCHALGSPTEGHSVSRPSHAKTCWAIVQTGLKANSQTFGLKRPPRA